MRTSRPLKHAPIPLLGNSSNGTSKKGKGKAKAEASSTSGGKKLSQAERRLEEARRAVREDNTRIDNASNRRKGKGKAIANEDEEDQYSEDIDQSGEGITDNTMDIRGMRLQLGLGDTNEGDSDDDEEIDSDLALTEGEGEDIDAKPSNKKKHKRAVAADFYQDVDLDENSRMDSDYNSEDDDEVYMDLSEMLDKREAKAKAKDDVATTASTSKKSKSKTASSANEIDLNEDSDNLKSFKPSLQDLGSGSEDGDESDEEEMDDEEVGSSLDDEDEDDDDDVEEDLDSDLDSDEEEDDPDRLAKLEALISGLASQSPSLSKRTLDASAEQTSESGKKKRKLLQNERTEAVPEGEFAAPSAGAGAKLTLESMLSSLSGSGSQSVEALKKSLRPLSALSSPASGSTSAPASPFEAEYARLTADEAALLARARSRATEKTAKKRARGQTELSGALPAPLAPLHQAKVERMAAKEKQEEEVKKWEDTVRAMKGISKDGADDPQSRLVLPLLGDGEGQGKGTSAAELVAKFTPSNDLEKQISSLIAATGASQSSLLATESSALMSALPANSSSASAAHDAARTAQLRLARELMFRAERRAKRVAKIKSRTFRKIAKRSRARNAEDGGEGLTMEEMEDLDALDGGSRAQEERERLEVQRARERATLRHASGKSGATAGGRWSRSLGGMDGMDDAMKDAVRARESKNELLRRKIQGRDSAGSSDSDTEAGVSDHDEEDEDEDAMISRTSKKLAQLRSEAQAPGLAAAKGIMGMKFMQRAVQRDNARVDAAIDDFDAQMGGVDEEGANTGKAGALVQGNAGRMVFAPGAQPSASNAASSAQAEASEDGNTNAKTRRQRARDTARTNGNVSVATSGPSADSTTTLLDYNPFASLTTGTSRSAIPSAPADAEEANPWLALPASDSGAKLSRKQNEQIGGRNGTSADKSALKVQKEQGKSKEALKKAKEEARVVIDLDKVLTTATAEEIPVSSPAEEKKRKSRENAPPPSSAAAPARARRAADSDEDESGSDNDSDALPESMKRAGNSSNATAGAFKQRDLVAAAFAGDNVVADFEAAKAAEIAADAPKEEDLSLPGWGSWTGKGARQTSKAKAKAKKHVKHIPGIAADQRKDAKYANVIISEKQDKKAKKYLTKDLPYPYTSVKQYEQRLALPSGAEWNTRGNTREMTMPRVLTKPGAVIKPVSRKV